MVLRRRNFLSAALLGKDCTVRGRGASDLKTLQPSSMKLFANLVWQ